MWRHLRGCHLGGLKFKLVFCREPSGGATSKGYFAFLRKNENENFVGETPQQGGFGIFQKFA
jgi:hypothetical protein